MDDEQLLDIVGELYDAAIEAERWPQALESLQRFLNGGAYAHFLWDKETGQVPLMYFAGYSPEIIKAYQDYYSAIEPGADFIRRNGGLPLLHDFLWTDDRAMDRDEYHAWLERESGMRYRLGGFVANTDRYFGITALQRSRHQGPASESDQRLFLRLLPHLRRATRISQEFNQLRTEGQSLIEALQHSRHGILFLDERGRVIFSNHAVEAILAQRDGLSLDRSGCLRAERSDERSELARLITATAFRGKAHKQQPGGALAITRPSGKRPFALAVVPFRVAAMGSVFKPAPHAAVYISCPDTIRSPAATLLRQAYSLTPAEIRLATTLLNVESLKETATKLGLTEASARQTLKRVFHKTDCHSQGALVKLLLSLS